MPAGFRRHFAGKTLRNVFTVTLKYAFWQASDHTDIFVNQRIESYLNNTINPRPLAVHRLCHVIPTKWQIVSWP